MNTKLKICMFLSIFLIFACFISAISAEDSNFTEFQDKINTNDYINLSGNVIEENGESELYINKTITINGNGYTIDAKNYSRIFNITKNGNLTLINAKLINAKLIDGHGGAISVYRGACIFINCDFISNNADLTGGAILIVSSNCKIVKCNFISNNANYGGGAIAVFYSNCTLSDCIYISNLAIESGSSVYIYESNCTMFNNTFKNSKFNISAIYIVNSIFNINYSNFYNLTAKYISAIKSEGKSNITIVNSKFENLKAEITAGAISNYGSNLNIINCTFVNISSVKNGGAIYIDYSIDEKCILNITNSNFINCSSGFGGAIVILNSAYLSIIENCNFIGNSAKFNGGAIYASYTNLTISNTNFIENKAISLKNSSNIINYGNGGAIYLDNSNTILIESNFEKNIATSQGGAIYLYEGDIYLKNTNTTANSKNKIYGIYGVFLNNYTSIKSNINDTWSLNNTYYVTVVVGEGISLKLVNDTIIIKNYTRFDLRDYGWVTPVKNQEHGGTCMAFGAIASIESSLLKKTNITYNLSEINLRNSLIRYSVFGRPSFPEGGRFELGYAYSLSWLGMISSNYDVYDELGKLSPIITNDSIHIQDILILNPRKNSTDNLEIKNAILKYGALDTTIFWNENYFNGETNAYYFNESRNSNHMVAIVGWDDNYSKNNFLNTPEGDGAFIIKNSWGNEWGDNGYFYISYYDTAIGSHGSNVAIINNTVNYNKNYQLDFSGFYEYMKNYTYYGNKFISVGNDSIAAVGTYFNNAGIKYEINVYVNGVLKHTQTGLSLFNGYSTIKLTKNVTVCENDEIFVTMKSNSVPVSTDTRIHLACNTSFVSEDGKNWKDISTIACLKVYTVEYQLNTTNLTKYYNNNDKFIADVGAANQTVIFNINGVNYTRITNEEGYAYLDIKLNPGKYTIITYVLGKEFNNTITILSTINSKNIIKTYKNNTQFIATFLNSDGEALINKTVKFNINGVIYTKITDNNGVARLNINLNPGDYIITTLNENTTELTSNNITVLSTIKSNDLVKYYHNQTQYKATFYNSDNTIMANKTVYFNINGVIYTKTTNSKGIASLNINLNVGNYTITAISPNGEYKSNNIEVKPVLLGNDLNKTFEEEKSYEVKVLNGQGRTLANQTVIMNINGIFYNKITDNNGIARLAIHLNPGEYIITATWNDALTSNKIRVE